MAGLSWSMNRYMHTHTGQGRVRRGEKVRSWRVSNHTEVNLWVVVDWHVDLLLGLGWSSVVRRWVVARDELHGLFNQLVSLLLQALLVAILASVDTTTEVVILRSWRGRSGCVGLGC